MKLKKAKEYADYILSNSTNDEEMIKAMSEVMFEMILEIGDLIKSRNIQMQSALKPIILEQDRKWKSVCKRIKQEGMRNSFMEHLKEDENLSTLLKEANV